jgi:hypothetical protein
MLHDESAEDAAEYDYEANDYEHAYLSGLLAASA